MSSCGRTAPIAAKGASHGRSNASWVLDDLVLDRWFAAFSISHSCATSTRAAWQ